MCHSRRRTVRCLEEGVSIHLVDAEIVDNEPVWFGDTQSGTESINTTTLLMSNRVNYPL